MKLSKLLKEYEKRKKLHSENINDLNKLIRESGADLGTEALHEMYDKIFTHQITITAIDDFIIELKKVVVEKEGIKKLNDAAPELLEACNELMQQVEICGYQTKDGLHDLIDNRAIFKIKEAIKKATE